MTTTQSSETGFVDLGDVHTYYAVDGSGEPLVLLHGGMATIDTFADLTAALAPSYRVHRPERRGHGRTPDVEGPITYEVMAADTVAYIEALGIGPVHLAGWSDGAVVGLLVALTRPDLVRSLVFIGSALTADGLPPELQPLPPHIPVESLPPFLRDMYAAVSPDGADHFDAVFAKLEPSWLALPYVELSELKALTLPTLVIVADHDMVTVAHADQIRNAIAGAQLAVVPGDHAVPLMRPGLIANLVVDFLGGS